MMKRLSDETEFELREARAMLFLRTRRYAEAITAIEEVLELAPDHAASLHNWSQCLFEMSRDASVGAEQRREFRARSVAMFRRRINVGFPDLKAHYSLAVALLHDGQYDDAARHFAACLELSPYDAPAHRDFGCTRFFQGRYEEALTHYRRATRFGPEDGSAWHGLGCVLLKTGDRSAAADAFANAVRLCPENPKYARSLAGAKQSAGASPGGEGAPPPPTGTGE